MGALLATLAFILSVYPAPKVNGVEFYDYLESTDWDELPNDLAPITPDPIRYLTFATEKDQSAWHSYYEKLWRNLPHTIKRRLRSPYRSDEIQRNALMALGNYASEAKMALPSILNVATNSQEFNKAFAMRAALYIDHDGPEVTEVFHQLLKNPAMRPTASAAIWSTRRYPSGIASSLLPLDWSDPSKPPINDLLAVSILGEQAASEINFIVAALDNPNEWGKAEGNLLTSLVNMGPVATNAIPSLMRRLEPGQSAGNKVLATQALIKMGPVSNAALPALNGLLQDDDPLVKCMSALSIAKIDSFSQDCMVAMLDCLDSKEQSSAHLTCDTSSTFGLQAMGLNKQQSIVWMMGEITPHPLMDLAMPRLKQMFTENPKHWVAGLLARAIWRQERDSEPLLPPLIKVLDESKDPQSTIWACVALGEMGSDAREAVTDLQSAGKRNLNVRQAAVAAIEKIISKPTPQ